MGTINLDKKYLQNTIKSIKYNNSNNTNIGKIVFEDSVDEKNLTEMLSSLKADCKNIRTLKFPR